MKFTTSILFLGSLAASLVSASPIDIEARQVATGGQCQGSETNGEGRAALCGPVVIPLQQLLRYQSANIGSSTGNILASANQLVNKISSGVGLTEVGDIVNAATNGLVSGNLIGVTNTLGALAVALTNVQPQCRCDTAQCLSNLQEANAESSSDQPNAPYACAVAKYSCAGFYSESQVEQLAPGCRGLVPAGDN